MFSNVDRFQTPERFQTSINFERRVGFKQRNADVASSRDNVGKPGEVVVPEGMHEGNLIFLSKMKACCVKIIGFPLKQAANVTQMLLRLYFRYVGTSFM